MQFFDYNTWVFIAIAVFFFLRLRKVLGKRTGNEQRPFDPYSGDGKQGKTSSNDNIVAMPKRSSDKTPDPVTGDLGDAENGVDEIDPKTAKLNKIVAPMRSQDPNFDPMEFLAGARVAYEMIVTAYAAGDRTQLKPLLSDDVYAGFEQAIAERESRNERVEFTFVGIDKANITETEADSKEVRVTVRFASELISATRDEADKVIDGSASKVMDVTDIWTFARDPRKRDPNWRLVATESA